MCVLFTRVLIAIIGDISDAFSRVERLYLSSIIGEGEISLIDDVSVLIPPDATISVTISSLNINTDCTAEAIFVCCISEVIIATKNCICLTNKQYLRDKIGLK